jgi:hypothetical protein
MKYRDGAASIIEGIENRKLIIRLPLHLPL